MSLPVPSQAGDLLIVSDLAPKARSCIFRVAEVRSYARGEVLFDQNNDADALTVLTSGAAMLSRAACGRSLILGKHIAPAVLATAGLLDGGRNAVTATAVCASAARLISRAELLHLCANCPGVLTWLLKHIAAHMRLLTSTLDLVTLGSVRQRLARVLFEMAQSSGTNSLSLDCNQDEFALTIGSVREVLFRNLRGLQTDGVLHWHGKHIIIDDLDALKHTGGLT